MRPLQAERAGAGALDAQAGAGKSVESLACCKTCRLESLFKGIAKMLRKQPQAPLWPAKASVLGFSQAEAIAIACS